jgi:hypothetical protein
MDEPTAVDDLTQGANPDEGQKERLDRELIELLNEVRVALPGVQVLFAFLLVLPFQGSFAELGGTSRDVYVGALLASAAAVALLITPSSYHRINFRRPVKERMIRLSNRLLLAGLVLALIATALSVGLVVDVVLGGVAGAVAAAAVAAWIGWFWFAIPLLARRGADAD